MGHRANFVVIRDGRASAYHDQWAALGCTYELSEGPVHATSVAESCEPTAELLDWAFAEAGFLLDHDSRVAMVFGYPEMGLDAEDLEEMGMEADEAGEPAQAAGELDASLQQGPMAFLQHIASRWSGWELRWDERGVDAFADYLSNRGFENIRCQPPSAPADREQVVLKA